MILSGPARLAIVAGLALMTAPASADVLEIGDDGARWIAGPNLAAPVLDAGSLSSLPVELGADYLVPAAAIADPLRGAAAVPPQYAAKVSAM